MRRLIIVLTFGFPVVVPAADYEYFEKHIRPILVNKCYDCHNADVAEGNLRLDLREGLLKGGQTGPAILPGYPSKSLLLKAVSYKDSQLKMPPVEAGGQITDTEVSHLANWIRAGAPDPRDGTFENDITELSKKHWAFQPLAQHEIPPDVHPIDHLLGQNLAAKQYIPLGTADTKSLIRRISYDLTGLPPTVEELSTDREGLEALIEHYLASPRYGERWGRHWLDVARYSDAKDGVLMYGDARIRPFAYTYRDYVIRAFNEDTPFDQFIIEQLAADQLNLAPDSPRLAAMGLLTLGRLFDNNVHDVIDDQIDVVSRGFLGLTVSCARCHDHKFDPIPTADYYSLYGVFASSEEPYNRPRIEEVKQTAKKFETAYTNKLKEIENRQTSLYAKTLQDARYRTTRHLVKAATTEPDNLETTIFFLSLIKGQLRPQITYSWREYLAEHAISGHRIFGPWADLIANPVLQAEKWRQENIEPRVIDAIVSNKPTTPAEIATIYGDLITKAWSARIDLETSIESLRSELSRTETATINLADMISGGDGFGSGEAGEAVHPTNGSTVKGSTSGIDADKYDTYFRAENRYVDGVFIPRDLNTQVVSSTGIKITDAPVGGKSASWDYIKYGPSQGATTTLIDGVDYGKPPNYMLGVHANKGFTIDLNEVRERHSFNTGVFKTVIGHGGAIGMSTVDFAIYLDGKSHFKKQAVKAQEAGTEISIPLSSGDRFLTILVTEGKDGISHDQGVLGNPRFEVGADPLFQQQLRQRKDDLQERIATLEADLESLPDPLTDELAQLLLGTDSPVWFPKRKLYFYLDRQDKDAYRGLLTSIDSIAVSDPDAAARAMIMVDKPQLYDPVIFQRGDPVQRGNPVPRQFLEFLSTQPRKPFTDGSGRLNLAQAIADHSNPLTPRVWANRVWMHHFGTPLVDDPSDFGLRNARPLQAKLLDYLAGYLLNNNYQTKPLHRMILTSAAYRRSSLITESNHLIEQQLIHDPDNKYYWRYNRRRIDLEQMRDTMLEVSGLLDPTMYGRPKGITDENNNRRSVYAFVERQNLPTIIQVFDAANADSSTSQRPSTTVPQQALFALNSPFMERITMALTDRIDTEQPIEQVEALYEYVLRRAPTPLEKELGTSFLQSGQLRDYTQVLLISNELWFID